MPPGGLGELRTNSGFDSVTFPGTLNIDLSHIQYNTDASYSALVNACRGGDVCTVTKDDSTFTEGVPGSWSNPGTPKSVILTIKKDIASLKVGSTTVNENGNIYGVSSFGDAKLLINIEPGVTIGTMDLYYYPQFDLGEASSDREIALRSPRVQLKSGVVAVKNLNTHTVAIEADVPNWSDHAVLMVKGNADIRNVSAGLNAFGAKGSGRDYYLNNYEAVGQTTLYMPDGTLDMSTVGKAAQGCIDTNMVLKSFELPGNYKLSGKVITNTAHRDPYTMSTTNIGITFVTSQRFTSDCGSATLATKIVDPEPPEPEYTHELTMTPDQDYSLMCGDDSEKSSLFTINVARSESESTLTEGYAADVTASLEGYANFNVTVQTGTGKYPNFTTNSSGKLVLKVTPKSGKVLSTTSSYVLKVTSVDDDTISTSAELNFVPFKFELNTSGNTGELNVVAGYPTSVDLQVLACDSTSGNPVVVPDYNKDPTVTFTKPSNGKGTVTYNPSITDGEAENGLLTIDNTGEFEITITDNDGFNCSAYAGCPIDGNGKLENTVTSRPWALALCQEDGSELPSGTNYMLSGESFNLQAKPLKWKTGYPKTISGDTVGKGYCSGDVATNFFTSTESANVSISTVELTYPEGGVIGTGIAKTVQNTQTTPDGQGVLLPNLSWGNVGSLLVEVSSTGYNNLVSKSTASLGVFVPYELSIRENTWTYTHSAGGSGFSYMGQPFDYSFTVEALSKAGLPTTNYGLFTNKSTNIDFIAVKKNEYTGGNTTESLKDRIDVISTSSANWGSNPSNISGATLTQTGTISFEKDVVRNSPYTTQEDGPYDDTTLALGLGASNVQLGVDFQATGGNAITIGGMTGQAFSTQPDIRYGRMTLEDKEGGIGRDLNIPLTVQYWNGSKFITNTSDNSTSFEVGNYCMSNSASNIRFKNATGNSSTKVENGESDSLMAYQPNSKFESVRLFLRQGFSKPSGISHCAGLAGTQDWLRYNWRNLGDEDPSANITFGATPTNRRVMSRTDKLD